MSVLSSIFYEKVIVFLDSDNERFIKEIKAKISLLWKYYFRSESLL